MYSRPPFVAAGGIALIVGVATVAFLAAPGAGLRYRLVGLHIGISRTVGAAVVDATVQDAGSGLPIARAPGAMQLTGTSGYYIPIPEPGVTIDPNAAMSASFASTVAAGSGIILAYYYIDRIS